MSLSTTYTKVETDYKIQEAKLHAYLGIATTTTTPPATGAYWYRVTTAGTYTNFLSGGSPIVVSAGDLTGNDVFLEVKDNVATKRVTVKEVGDSAYEIAVNNGYVGTEAQWLASLEGDNKIDTWTAKTYNAGEQVIYQGVIYEANAAVLAVDIPSKFSTKWIEQGHTNSKRLGVECFLSYWNESKKRGVSFIGVDKPVSYAGNALLKRDGTTSLVGGVYLQTVNEFPLIVNSMTLRSESKFIIYFNDADELIEIIDFDKVLNEYLILPEIKGATKAKFTSVGIPTLKKYVKEKIKSNKSQKIKTNLVQNRFVKFYEDINYPNLHPENFSQLTWRLNPIDSTIINDYDFSDSRVYARNSTIFNTYNSLRISYGGFTLSGQTDRFLQFKVKIPSNQDRAKTGLLFSNINGALKIYKYNGELNGSYGSSGVGISDVKIIDSVTIDGFLIQTWRVKWTLDPAVTSTLSFSIGNSSDASTVNDSIIGDIILSEDVIDENFIYQDLPAQNKSSWIGKNIMLHGDSNLRGSMVRILMDNLGCNVFKNGNGGRSMKYRVETDFDNYWLYHWDRRKYIKDLYDAGIVIDAFIFNVSYNDNAGGGEITYPNIQAVEDNYPLISDDSATISAKLSIFNAMTFQQKVDLFKYQQTYVAFLKQIIELYPKAYIQLNKLMYNPAGVNNASTYTEDTTIQRTYSKPKIDQQNSEMQLVGDWFGIPVENISKSTRYYFGNMTDYTPDTIHFDQEIGRRLGIGLANKLLEVRF
jgi:hypothetical protein